MQYVDCNLSPIGKFYYGLCHLDIAKDICENVLKRDDIINPERYLEELGWMKYINRCHVGWWIHPTKRPTQAQINAAFDETQIDVTNL